MIASTAYQLFHRHFAVRVPNMFCYSIVQIEQIGRHTTGNRQVDDELDKVPRDMLLTPVAIMTYYEEGSPVWFDTRQDVSDMYRLIIEHLNNWNYLLSVHLDVDHPPAEDFIRLDTFAEAIFPLTIFTVERPMQLGLQAKLTGLGIGNRRGFSRIRNAIANDGANGTAVNPAVAKLRHQSCILQLINRIDTLGGL